MAKRRGRAFYEQLSALVDQGSSVAEVARRHGVEPKTLTWWRWKLRQKPTNRPSKSRTTALVPVVVRGAAHGALVELSLGHCQLAFEVGTDPDYVAALARALVHAC